MRKLVALGLFNDVKVRQREHDGVVDLVVTVVERPRIGAIHYSGNKKREDVDLEKKTFLKPGDTYTAVQARTQVDSLLKYYHDEGFARAKVTPKLDTLQTKNEVNLTFVVDEGEKVRITKITFAGRTAFPEKRLRKAMKTKQHWFLGGGDIKDDTFTEDREALERWYHDHGYRDMKAQAFDLEPGKEPRNLTLRVTLDEGRPYVLGNATWSGNKVVATPTLVKLWTARAGAMYDRGRIERTTAAAYGEYAEYGYLYLNVDPRESVRDSVVDVDVRGLRGRPFAHPPREHHRQQGHPRARASPRAVDPRGRPVPPLGPRAQPGRHHAARPVRGGRSRTSRRPRAPTSTWCSRSRKSRSAPPRRAPATPARPASPASSSSGTTTCSATASSSPCTWSAAASARTTR